MSECDPATLKQRLERLEEFRPLEMADCWWVAIRYENGTLELRSTHSSVASAEQRAELIREQSARWLRQPEEVNVVKETPDLTAASREGGWYPVIARWNWLDRHAERLVSAAEPRRCRALFTKDNDSDVTPGDLLQHRLGGCGVLPKGLEWPVFDIPQEPQEAWQRGKRILGSYYRDTPFPGATVFGSFLRVIDLRGEFDFGHDFPDALSLFVCTFDMNRETYGSSSVHTFPMPDTQAVVVPLFATDCLEFREPPGGVPKLTERRIDARKLPDFPRYGWGSCRNVIKPTGLRSLLPFQRPQYEWISGPIDEAFDAIETQEPDTGGWICVDVSKIGGYPCFLQNDLLEKLRCEEPAHEWHLIASVRGDVIEIGDGGMLYVFAGRDRRHGDWCWHCEMQW